MKTEKQQQLMDDYLNGVLSDEDLMLLRKEVELDPELLEELRNSKELLVGLKVQHKNSVKAELTALYQKTKLKKEEKRRINPFYYYGIAASFLLLIALGVVFFTQSSKNSHEEIYATYYKPMAAVSNYRGTDTEDIKSVAIEYYKNQNYLAASHEFKLLLKSNKEDVYTKILLSNCYLNINKEQEAIAILAEIKDVDDLYYSQYIYWYLGLAYLKTDQVEKCQEIMSVIIASNMIHAKKANELLVKLQNL